MTQDLTTSELRDLLGQACMILEDNIHQFKVVCGTPKEDKEDKKSKQLKLDLYESSK